MPNVRKKGKKFAAAWVSGKIYADVQRAARRQNKTLSEIVCGLLGDYAEGTLHDAPINPPQPPAHRRLPD